MKKLLKIFVLACALSLCLSLVCSAEEFTGTEDTQLKDYITEKIAPVVAGVLTSAIALVTTLGSIAKSLNSLKDTKSAFSKEAQERADNFNTSTKLLENKADELKASVQCVPQLEGELIQLKKDIELLTSQCVDIAEILCLGFSANSDIIRSGKGKKMSVLLDSAKCKLQGAILTKDALPLSQASEPANHMAHAGDNCSLEERGGKE